RREFGYVLLSLPVSVLAFSYAVTLAFAGSLLLVTFLGIPVLAVGLAGCRGFGVLERRMARGLLGLDVAEPETVRGRKPGV
ncbi:sensor domain-containing protein, partial [Streptomyces graminilatus]|uniref:sensor domain-containing protein n=1 Tax=Streptomyces graminilatus TaxID=1464070 RepID=UPI001F52620A